MHTFDSPNNNNELIAYTHRRIYNSQLNANNALFSIAS